VSIAVKTFGVCDFSRLAVTDWRLRRWRLWFLALLTATPLFSLDFRELLPKGRNTNQSETDFGTQKAISRTQLISFPLGKEKQGNSRCGIGTRGNLNGACFLTYIGAFRSDFVGGGSLFRSLFL